MRNYSRADLKSVGYIGELTPIMTLLQRRALTRSAARDIIIQNEKVSGKTMDFRERLIKLRDENKLSQQEMADKLDVTRQTVSRWESGKSYPSIQQIAGICRTFHIGANELLDCDEGTIERPPEPQKQKKRDKKFIAAAIVLCVLFAAALGGLIATIAYAVKDAQYDTSSTVWIVSIPQNTPMIVLCVFLGLFMLLIAAVFAYLITRGKGR